jgi:hypothetical protein
MGKFQRQGYDSRFSSSFHKVTRCEATPFLSLETILHAHIMIQETLMFRDMKTFGT